MAGKDPNVEFILLAARHIASDSQRTAYLDEACDGDSALRQLIERKLQQAITQLHLSTATSKLGDRSSAVASVPTSKER